MQCFIGYFMLLCFFSGAVSSAWTEDNCGKDFNKKCCPELDSDDPGDTGCLCRCDKVAVQKDNAGEAVYCMPGEGAWPKPDADGKAEGITAPTCGEDMKQFCCPPADPKRKSKIISASQSSNSDSSSRVSSSVSASDESQKESKATSELELDKHPMSKMRDSNKNSDSESHSHSKGRYTSLTRSESDEATKKSKKTREDQECACRCKAADGTGTCDPDLGGLYKGDHLDSAEITEDGIEGTDSSKSEAKKLQIFYGIFFAILIPIMLLF